MAEPEGTEVSPETETEAESSPEEQTEVEAAEVPVGDAEHLEAAEPEAEGDEAEASDPEAEATPEPEPSEEEPAYKPFSFTADGKRVDVEGASLVDYLDSDGNAQTSVVLPREVWLRQVQPYLADRGAFAKKEADFKRQITELDPANNETVIRAQSLLDELSGVLDSEEKLTEFLENFDGNKELWKLRADAAASDARLKASDQRDSTEQSERDQTAAVERIEGDLPNAVRQIADVLKADHGVDVDDRALAAAADEIADNLGTYYRYATEADAEAYGVSVGEVVRDDDRFARTINRYGSLLSAGSEQQSKTDEARKKNLAALTKKEVPPTVAATTTPAPAEKDREFKNAEEWRAAMGLN